MTANRFSPYTVHPVADLFPLLEEEEMEALATDIKENGLIHPILILGRKLIEGRNRFLACKKAEIEPRFKELRGEPTEQDIIKRIISSNLKRRHMTVGQRAMIAQSMIPHLATIAAESLAEGRIRGGRSTADSRESVPASETPTARANHQAAALVNVGHASIGRARAVAENSAVLARQVRNGDIELNAAYRQVRQEANQEGPQRTSNSPNRARDMTWGQSLTEFLAGIRKLKRGMQGLEHNEWHDERRRRIAGSVRELERDLERFKRTAGLTSRPNLRAV